MQARGWRASRRLAPPPQVKPVFEDAAKYAPRSVMHITASRFRRAVKMLFSDLTMLQVDGLIEARSRRRRREQQAAAAARARKPPCRW